mgnify:CR=1 FL=1
MRDNGCDGCFIFFFQAEDGIRDAQESRGLGDVYKRQLYRLNCMSHVPLYNSPDWRRWPWYVKAVDTASGSGEPSAKTVPALFISSASARMTEKMVRVFMLFFLLLGFMD